LPVTETVQSFLRVRPLNQHEILTYPEGKCLLLKGNKVYIKKKLDSPIINEEVERDRTKFNTYSFKKVFDEHDSQEQVFQDVGLPAVKDVLNGYNSAIIAHGGCATGRTHTIKGNETEEGLVPRSLKEILNQQDLIVSLSCLEIYNNITYDLLPGEGPFKNVTVREKEDRSFFCEGLTSNIVTCYENALELLKKATNNRNRCQTMMNNASSRSHVIYTITVQKSANDNTQKGKNSNH